MSETAFAAPTNIKNATTAVPSLAAVRNHAVKLTGRQIRVIGNDAEQLGEDFGSDVPATAFIIEVGQTSQAREGKTESGNMKKASVLSGQGDQRSSSCDGMEASAGHGASSGQV